MFTIVNKPVAAAGPAEWLHGRQQSGAHELDVRPRLRGGRKRMTVIKRDGDGNNEISCPAVAMGW